MGAAEVDRARRVMLAVREEYRVRLLRHRRRIEVQRRLLGIIAGEEVVGGRVLGLADHPPGDAEQNAEIAGDDEPVDLRQPGLEDGGCEPRDRHDFES